ncbi:DUF3316 domain-containing protein [Vibrio fluvialis]|nr:DUF3316 domain-containing protein [Vibrio fluvialis]
MFKKIALCGLAALIVSSLANASMITKVSTSTISGDIVSSESTAIEQARQLLNDVNNMSSRELSKTLNFGTSGNVDITSYKVIKSNASVERFVTETGFNYKPVISVNYEYEEVDRN